MRRLRQMHGGAASAAAVTAAAAAAVAAAAAASDVHWFGVFEAYEHIACCNKSAGATNLNPKP